MEKQLLTFLLLSISMLLFGQNLNDRISISIHSIGYTGGGVGDCTIGIRNSSDCNIKLFNVYASNVETGEIFFSDTNPNTTLGAYNSTSIQINFDDNTFMRYGEWNFNVVYINLNDGYTYMKTVIKPKNTYGTGPLSDASTKTDVSNLNNEISIYLSSMKSGYINGVIRDEAELVIHNNSNNELKANNIFVYNASKSDIFFSNISPDFNIRAGESTKCKIFCQGGNYLMKGGWYLTMIYSNVADGNVYLKTVLMRENGYNSAIPLEDASTPTGINSISMEMKDEPIGIFSPSGYAMSQSQRGLNIIRMKNGETKKVINK